MAGGGPNEVFKIVTFTSGGTNAMGQSTYESSTHYVRVSEANRMKIAEALGITDPATQKQLLSGVVNVFPPAAPAPKAAPKRSPKK